MVEPPEVFRILPEAHIPKIAGETRQMLLLRGAGASFRQIGEKLGYTERTVRDRVAPILDAVFIPHGIEQDNWVAGAWIAFHHQCCLG